MKRKLLAYLTLTKPTIALLVLITGSTALFMEGSFVQEPLNFLGVLLGLFLTSGSAAAFNQYLERDIDKQMSRTAKKRPLTNGSLAPMEALVFAIVIGIVGVALFAIQFNLLSAALALVTVLFYSFFYTLWLKPRTAQNIVIGGAAGAMGPIIAWAAATNGLSLTPWVLFLIIFFWTPPHFWALAFCLKEDYKRVKYPMMPVVKSDPETLRLILIYTIITVGFTLILPVLPHVGTGLIYFIAAFVLGSIFVWLVERVRRTRQTKQAWGVFAYSIVYLLVLFLSLIVDRLVPVMVWNS
ncbi:MAG: heme o synthase [Candidatus Sumerlaeia bacterium]|nr:heme o synthase [Candidatus Sumerlaeia bacterium]